MATHNGFKRALPEIVGVTAVLLVAVILAIVYMLAMNASP